MSLYGILCVGLSFTYQLLYLLDATGFYSLGLQALGIQVCRATGQELVLTSSFLVEISCHHYLTMHPIELGRFGFVGWYYLKFYIHLAARCYTIID
jgi:hypothetical protein